VGLLTLLRHGSNPPIRQTIGRCACWRKQGTHAPGAIPDGVGTRCLKCVGEEPWLAEPFPAKGAPRLEARQRILAALTTPGGARNRYALGGAASGGSGPSPLWRWRRAGVSGPSWHGYAIASWRLQRLGAVALWSIRPRVCPLQRDRAQIG